MAFKGLEMKVGVIIGVVVGVTAVLLVILLPMSFQGLEYYEMGFARKKSTGSVDTGKVYTGGKHLVGPDHEFKKFRADAHFLVLSDVTVFTQDKLELSLTVTFQYFLRPDELRYLHKQYDINYKAVMSTSAIDALKGAAPRFNTRKFFEARAEVEEALYKAIRERLGGKCCARSCDSYKFACIPGCMPRSQCSTANYGLFVDVKYFQLGEVDIPEDIKNRFLRALTLQEESDREILLQEAQIVRKETDAMIRRIKNEALEKSQNGTAQSELIGTIASGNYTATVEKARSEGLKGLYSTLGITDPAHRASFDYLRTLNNLDNVHLTVDFQQRIVGFGSGN